MLYVTRAPHNVAALLLRQDFIRVLEIRLTKNSIYGIIRMWKYPFKELL